MTMPSLPLVHFWCQAFIGEWGWRCQGDLSVTIIGDDAKDSFRLPVGGDDDAKARLFGVTNKRDQKVEVECPSTIPVAVKPA